MTPRSISESLPLCLSCPHPSIVDLTLIGKVVPLQTCLWEGLLLYLSIHLAVASPIHHVPFAPSSFGSASLNWET